MTKNYFEYQGEKHYTGTVCISKENKRIIFLEYDEDADEITYLNYPFRDTLPSKHFFNKISYVTYEVKQNPSKAIKIGRFKELDIDGMPQAWVLYIILMAFWFIFKDRF